MATNDFQKRIIQEFIGREFKIQILKEDIIYMTNALAMTVEIYPDKYMVFNAKYKQIFEEQKTEPGEHRIWLKKKYDKNGNLLHSETSTGLWDDYTYDNNNQLLKHVASSGLWEKYEYTEFGEQSFYMNSQGFWERCDFDSQDRLIHKYTSDYHWIYYYPEMNFEIEGYKSKVKKIRQNKKAYRLNKARFNNYNVLLSTGLLYEGNCNRTYSKDELFLFEKISEVSRIEEKAEQSRQRAELEEKKKQRLYRDLWDA